jgi:hypothetical protein
MSQLRPGATEQWRRRIADQQASGLSIAAFCRAQHLSENTFYLWKRLLQQGNAEGKASAAASFVEVKSSPRGAGRPAGTAGEGCAIEVRLRNHRRLRVRPGFSRTLLAELMSVLEALP